MPEVPKCPDDGSWLAVIPTPRSTSYLCRACGRAFEASMKDGSLMGDPTYSSLPKWFVEALREIASRSAGA